MRDKQLHKAATTRWREAHKSRHLETQRRYRENMGSEVRKERNRKQWLRKRYGLTPEQVEGMYAKQNGKCGICEQAIPLLSSETHIDHCHTTGQIRGLLCRKCNLRLAAFDDREFFTKALKYLGDLK